MTKKNELKIGFNEFQNGVPVGDNVLDTRNTPIPIESLKVLMTGDSNDRFRVISKRISKTNVKLVLKHRETKELVKIVTPIEFLELHRIPYKNISIPSDKQIEGVLNERVESWECKIIIKDLSTKYDLVVLLDKESQKTIACKVPIEAIEKTKLYIDKCQNYKQANFSYNKINQWRESECQREIMIKLSLLKSTQSTIQMRV